MRKFWMVMGLLLMTVTPLIEIGGMLISHHAISRVTIAVVLYTAGVIWGFMIGFIWGKGGIL